MIDQQQLFVKMALDAWSNEIKYTNALLEKLSDDQLMHEVSPGRNRGIYLLGHLTAEHDEMLPLLRFQEAMHPELMPVFMDAPDKAFETLPSIQGLRSLWTAVNIALMDHMRSLPPEEWFTRHRNISAEDFPKEPHRNRLNVVLSRTNHLAYHRGQLALLTSTK
ncbi:MAG TPA: DinB family protein [Flavobacteriales bacterium]|nr:DinB family protein [Flavobacteriales bacterium]